MVDKAPPMQGDEIEHCPKCGTKVLHADGIGDFCPNKNCDVADNLLGVEWNWEKPMTLAEQLTAAEARGYERGRLEALAGVRDDNDYKRGLRDGNAEWLRVHNLGREEGDKKGFLRCREEAARVCEAQYESVNRFERSVIAAAIRSLKP